MTVTEKPSLLLVEDNALIALALEDVLLSAGYRVIGPVLTLADALVAVNGEPFDLALLDITLGQDMVFPVAERLAAQGRPFVFLTGASRAALPPSLADRPLLIKPFTPENLLEIIHRTLAETTPSDLSVSGRT